MNRRSFFAGVTAFVFGLFAARPRKSEWTHIGKVYHGRMTDVYINGKLIRHDYGIRDETKADLSAMNAEFAVHQRTRA